MVKIYNKLSIFGLIFVLMLSVAYADNLEFIDLDVKVGGKTDKNIKDGDRISRDAEPGDNIEFRIEVKNNFTEDIEIEDIEVEVIIEGIDDGDDLDDTASEFDLRDGRDKRVSIDFQIPTEVEEDTYDVTITAQGSDENGTDHFIEMVVQLDVDKQSHDIQFSRLGVTPNSVSCARRNVQIDVGVINLGNDDEEDVVLTIVNNALGINIVEEIGDLDAEPNEPESKFSEIYTVTLDEAEVGSYPIVANVNYGNNRDTEERITLTVNECGFDGNSNNEITEDNPILQEILDRLEEQEEASEVVLVAPPPTDDDEEDEEEAEQTQINLPPGAFASQEGGFTGSGVIIAVILIVIFLLIIIGIVAFMVLKR